MKSGRRTLIIIVVVALCIGVFAGRSLPSKWLGERIAEGKTHESNAPRAGKVSLGYANGGPAGSEPTASTLPESVPTTPVETVMQDNFLRLTGTLAADEKSAVASSANGIVKAVLVDRGSLVEKGDVIVIVDPTDAQNMLAEALAGLEEIKASLGWDGVEPYRIEDQPGVRTAKAELDLAKANYQRYSDLQQSGAVPKLRYDQARTDYETAQQRYQQAVLRAKQLYQSYHTVLARGVTIKKAVDDTVITAPFSGWVAEKLVSVGERVTTNPMGSGATVVSLVRIDPLRLVLTVPQQYAAAIHEGQQVNFKVEGFPDRTFAGEVKFVAPSLERNSRSLTVEALVANADRTLHPGQFATAELVLPDKKEVFAIPIGAVVKTGDIAKVYTVRDGQVIEKVVAVGETQGDRILVTAGLLADDVVVTAPDRLPKTGESS